MARDGREARNRKDNFQAWPPSLTLQEIAELMVDYDLEVDGADEQGNGIWRLITDRGIRGLHLVRFSEPRLLYLYSVMEHLAQQGLRKGPRMIRNKHGQPFSVLESGRAVYLTDWLHGRPCSFSRTDQTQEVARLLAKLHLAAEGFQPEPGSASLQVWGQWPDKFIFRLRELRQFGEQAKASEAKSKLDKLYLENLDYYLHQGEQAMELLDGPEYQALVEQESTLGVFCFRDIEGKHILCQEGSLVINSFDYCIGDLRAYDLSRLLRKMGSGNHWDWPKAKAVLAEYTSIRPLTRGEKKALLALLTFPRKFWLYSRRYYTKGQVESGELVDRLKRAIRSEGERVEFLNRLQDYANTE
ncbi:MAG: CotS family spore coat protein [Carboxydocellales bacterium]